MEKHKIASISLTMRDRAIFQPTGYLRKCILANFQKSGGHFEFLPKMAKHKITSISLTVRDRAISSKFSTHRVYKKCTLTNFEKIFPSSKMAAILDFCQKWKNTKLLLSP